MDSLMYKTPSPATAKRRLPGIPVTTGRRVVSDQISRITQREWPELVDDREQQQRSRRGSIATTSGGELLKGLKEETDSVDSSMGFRELERHIAKIKRQNFDLKLELHIRREKMTANAEKLQQAERLIEESEELHETLRETRLALKARDDELVDCKALIRLLSDQLENAHNRITSFTTSPRHSSPMSEFDQPSSLRKTPTLQQTEFPHEAMKLSPGSPESLRSLSESTIASGSEEDEDMESIETDLQDETIIHLRACEEIVAPRRAEKEIRMPLRLEHSPKTTRRQTLLEEISPQRTPMYADRRQSQISAHSRVSSHRNSRIYSDMQPQLLSPPRESSFITPAVSKVTDAVQRNYLPPTPDDTPIPVKPPVAQRTMTLRSRLFRSKSNLPEPETNHHQDEETAALTAPTKQVVKKNSLIRFWKSKSAENKDDSEKKPPAKQVFNYPPSPDKTPKPNAPGLKENIKMPHESDQLSRYPKVRPLSVATTTTTTPPTSMEWRQSIGRQVTEMVQHWEEETSRRSNRSSGASSTSSAAYSSKRASRDVTASPLAVKAARDAWTAKAIPAKTGALSSRDEHGKGLKVDKLRSKRDELVRKLGLSTVPPNAAAA